MNNARTMRCSKTLKQLQQNLRHVKVRQSPQSRDAALEGLAIDVFGKNAALTGRQKTNVYETREMDARQLTGSARFTFIESSHLFVVELGLDQADGNVLIRRLVAPLIHQTQRAASEDTFNGIPASENLAYV
jgi:hypothetical protein